LTVLSILEVIEDTRIGGAQKVCLDLCRCLTERRHDVVLAVVGRSGPLTAGLATTGIETVFFDEPPRKCHFRLSRRLCALVRGRAFDIVHSHMFVPNTWTALACITTPRVAFIPTEHTAGAWKRPHHRVADRLVYGRADAVAAVSATVREVIAAASPAIERKVAVIENGVAVPAAITPGAKSSARRGLDIPENAFVVTAVGRLTWEKDHATLIDAAAVLRECAPETIVLVVGSGALESELVERAGSASLSGTVRFLGTRTDVGRILAASDVFTMPSVSEGSPLALLEAMAAGLAPVVSDIPALAGKVRNERTGMVVPVGRPRMLAEALIRLYRDRTVSAELGRRAREHVSAGFTMAKTVDCYEELFTRLVKVRR